MITVDKTFYDYYIVAYREKPDGFSLERTLLAEITVCAPNMSAVQARKLIARECELLPSDCVEVVKQHKYVFSMDAAFFREHATRIY